MTKLTAYEDSQEIKALAQEFTKAVLKGGIFSPQGPYALNSPLRPDRHYGTSNAPTALLARMEHLKDKLAQENTTAETYGILSNLGEAVRSMDYAERAIATNHSPLTPQEKEPVLQCLQTSLPVMRDTVAALRAKLGR